MEFSPGFFGYWNPRDPRRPREGIHFPSPSSGPTPVRTLFPKRPVRDGVPDSASPKEQAAEPPEIPSSTGVPTPTPISTSATAAIWQVLRPGSPPHQAIPVVLGPVSFPVDPARPEGSTRSTDEGGFVLLALRMRVASAEDVHEEPEEPGQLEPQLEPPGDALLEPWSTEPLEIPPEELDMEELGIFKGMEDLLTVADKELYQKYLSGLHEHVELSFASQQPIMELMRSELARRVFVPFLGEWTGILGVDPLELLFLATMPERMAAHARPLNPITIEKAWPLFEKMCRYFFEPSRSPCASPIVLAPKATPPYVRICGDYRRINQYIVVPQDIIPNVRKELEKTRDFTVYADLDCMNAFHQLRLAPYTRERLAVATPWGLFQPMFLPEGVGPASGALQKAMEDVFRDFRDWMIIMFDNLLVMATDYDDLYQKVHRVFQRCDERHVILKLEKSFIGVTTAHFFGYEVSGGSYKLSQKRRDAVAAIPMPRDQKSMQRFLGAALYFKTHVPSYSDLTADLNEMVKKDFDWNPATWTKDYVGALERLKEAILQSATLHFPDYALPWVLRCDASEKACGGTLLQERQAEPSSPPTFEVISFVSTKFSGAACRWDIPKKEAFAIYFSVRELAYYLEVKPFTIETDHANLVWIEKSDAAIIIRWRLYLQGFSFKIRHIPGKANVFADMLSRMYLMSCGVDPSGSYGDGPFDPSASGLYIMESLPDELPPGPLEYNVLLMGAVEYPPVTDSLEDFLRQAHIVNRKHCGVRETRANLNRFFPGHRIHYDVVNEFCASCVICQKNRRGMLKLDIIEPVIKNLKPAHRRSRIGIDTFHCSPQDKMGHVCIHVIVNHFSNFVSLHPSKDHTAVGMARALFEFFCRYGLCDEVASDPGSNLTADVTEELLKLFGTKHRFGLVGVHTSSGVEGTNSLVLAHLRAICADKSFRDRWGSPEVTGLVQYMINDSVSTETGIRRFDNMFGSEAGVYFKMPEFLAGSARSHEYLRLLDEDLQRLSDISRKAHAKVIDSRRTVVTDDTRNVYLRGELVLLQRDPDKPLPSKLTMPFSGPYEVIDHVGNDVKIRHLATHAITEHPVTRLKIFHGTREQGKASAAQEVEQSQVRAITAWRGDPLVRTTMEFRVEFEDGDVIWLPYSVDLDQTQAYGTYVASLPVLSHLQFSAQHAREFLSQLRSGPVSGYAVGDKLYVDIRCYSTEWYDSVLTFLPDRYDKLYVVLYEVTGVHPRYIKAYCPVYDERWEAATGPCKLGGYWCHAFGCHRVLTDNMVLITPDLCRQHPELISPDPTARQRVLDLHFPLPRVSSRSPVVSPIAPTPQLPPGATRVLRSQGGKEKTPVPGAHP